MKAQRTRVGEGGRALEQQGGDPVHEGAVHAVRVARDPADVRHAPEHVAGAAVKHQLREGDKEVNEAAMASVRNKGTMANVRDKGMMANARDKGMIANVQSLPNQPITFNKQFTSLIPYSSDPEARRVKRRLNKVCPLDTTASPFTPHFVTKSIRNSGNSRAAGLTIHQIKQLCPIGIPHRL